MMSIFLPEILIFPLGHVENLLLLLGTVVLGLEVGVHGPVHPGGVGGQVEVDDQPEEPDLEPAPFPHRFKEYVVQTFHFVFFCFFDFILTKLVTERFDPEIFATRYTMSVQLFLIAIFQILHALPFIDKFLHRS